MYRMIKASAICLSTPVALLQLQNISGDQGFGNLPEQEKA
jgi:hypothetical protein